MLCPITEFLMRDPVMTSAGVTYDRTTLQNMFDVQARCGLPKRDPLTGVPLRADEPLIPNRKLRSQARTHLCMLSPLRSPHPQHLAASAATERPPASRSRCR